MNEKRKEIGRVIHYFSRIGVGVVELKNEIKLGDKIQIEGATTSFTQTVESMEIDKKKIDKATAGQLIGLKVKDRVRVGDKVYKIGT